MKTKVETEVVFPQPMPTIVSTPPEAGGEAGHRFSILALGSKQLCSHPNLGFPASRTVRKCFSVG